MIKTRLIEQVPSSKKYIALTVLAQLSLIHIFLTGIKTVFIITTAMNGAILQTVRSTLPIQDL